ncbi:MAG: hypothetical protein WAQ99_01965 [Pyrinomonadaceae bacterium]
MTLKDSEGIRLLADHIKSIWALSAGGIAFGSGLLGFISKDVAIPWYAYLICLILVLAGLSAYTYSVRQGIKAHKKLTDEVFRSEQVLVTSMNAKSSIESILKTYYRSRLAFFLGCLGLAIGVVGFATSTNLVWKVSKPTHFSVLLKGPTVITQDSRNIEIDTLSFRIADPKFSAGEISTVEIQNLVFKSRTVQTPR